MQAKTDLNRIVIDENLIANPAELYEGLKDLYLGDPQTYQVFVRRKHLDQLEKVMDQIITECGVLPVDFDYSLMFSLCEEELPPKAV